MIRVEGETYHTATGAMRLLNVSRWVFYERLKAMLNTYEIETCKRPLYKESELAKLQTVRVKEAV